MIEQVFDALSSDQVEMLKLKTDIQRTDSTLVSSNINRYSRVQLLIEVLLRLERILDETDMQNIGVLLQPYLKTGSAKYVYGLKSADLPRELETIGKVYQAIHYALNKSTRYLCTIEFDNMTIPKERRKFRPNVEATMNEYKVKTRNGKLKVRGLFKTSLFAFSVGIAINFGRIFRYLVSIDPNNGFSSSNIQASLEKLLNFVCLNLKLTVFEFNLLKSKRYDFIQFLATLNLKSF